MDKYTWGIHLRKLWDDMGRVQMWEGIKRQNQLKKAISSPNCQLCNAIPLS
jgi:hypothetical protein